MRFPAGGSSREDILASLGARKGGDVPWEEGRVFAYIYDAGEEAKRLLIDAFNLYFMENGLDPTSFPSCMELEKDVIGMAVDLMQGGPDATGTFTSGGTESILLAMKTAREWGREQFFTTTRAARLDGLGDATQYGPIFSYKLLGAQGPLTLKLRYLRTDVPGRSNVALNKYGIGDRTHYTFDLRYHFSGLLQGLRLRFLYIRISSRDEPPTPEALTNRAGFNHFNLVANFLF